MAGTFVCESNLIVRANARTHTQQTRAHAPCIHTCSHTHTHTHTRTHIQTLLFPPTYAFFLLFCCLSCFYVGFLCPHFSVSRRRAPSRHGRLPRVAPGSSRSGPRRRRLQTRLAAQCVRRRPQTRRSLALALLRGQRARRVTRTQRRKGIPRLFFQTSMTISSFLRSSSCSSFLWVTGSYASFSLSGIDDALVRKLPCRNNPLKFVSSPRGVHPAMA